MPNQKLTDLTALPSVMASGDKVYVVRSGTDYQADQTDLQVAVDTQVTGLGTNVATFLATPSSANLAAAVTDETGTGALVLGTNPSLAGYTLTGARVVTPTTLAGTEVDVTKPESVKALSSSPTLTFSNATPTTGTEFRLTLTADGTDRTATIPSSFSINLGQNRTTIPVPANNTAALTFRYTGARWEVFGDPVATVGSGSYVLATAPTLSGAVQLDENASIALDPAGSADGKFSGISISGTAGATLAFGDLCYLNNDDSRWELADANLSDGYDKLLGMCVRAAASDGDPTRLLLFGQIRADAKFPTLTVGAPAYMSETAGAVVVTAPSTSGEAVRVVGHALTADEMLFNPSSTTVVLS